MQTASIGQPPASVPSQIPSSSQALNYRSAAAYPQPPPVIPAARSASWMPPQSYMSGTGSIPQPPAANPRPSVMPGFPNLQLPPPNYQNQRPEVTHMPHIPTRQNYPEPPSGLYPTYGVSQPPQ